MKLDIFFLNLRTSLSFLITICVSCGNLNDVFKKKEIDK